MFALSASAADRYLSYAELSKHEREGVDYRVTIEDRRSPVSVLAIHGGRMEKGTSELARLIAGGTFNEYALEGLKPSDNFALHLTSARFDEPRALELVSRSETCVSIHAFSSRGMTVCAGGQDTGTRDAMVAAFRARSLPFESRVDCPGLEGTSPQNIVNRCHRRGVQLELSTALHERLLSRPELASDLAAAVREVISTRLIASPVAGAGEY